MKKINNFSFIILGVILVGFTVWSATDSSFSSLKGIEDQDTLKKINECENSKSGKSFESYFTITSQFDVDWSGCDLTGTILRHVSLEEANLNGADLSGADLTGANLKGSDLREAKLYGADLREADLYKANLENAILDGTDLRDTVMEDVNLNHASLKHCLLYTSPSPRDGLLSRMPSSA